MAYVYSVVLNDESILTNRSFVESIDFKQLRFDPEFVRSASKRHASSDKSFDWTFDPHVLSHFTRAHDKGVHSLSQSHSKRSDQDEARQNGLVKLDRKVAQ